MKRLFSRGRREPPATQEPVLEARLLQEREENERFLRQLYANQDPGPAGADASPEPSGMEAGPPGRGVAVAPVDPAVTAATVPDAEPAAPAEPAEPAAGAGSGGEAARDGTRAALELLEVARQLLEGREDVESRVARQLVARALELMSPADGGRRG